MSRLLGVLAAALSINLTTGFTLWDVPTKAPEVHLSCEAWADDPGNCLGSNVQLLQTSLQLSKEKEDALALAQLPTTPIPYPEQEYIYFPWTYAEERTIAYLMSGATLLLGASIIGLIHYYRYKVEQKALAAAELSSGKGHGEVNSSPPLDLSKPSVISYIQEHALAAPERTAMVGFQGSERVEVSYRELELRVRTVAQQLESLGNAPGAVIAVMLNRGIHQVVTSLAIVAAECTVLPIDLAAPPDRIRYLLQHSGARTAVVEGGGSPPPGLGTEVAFITVKDDGSSLEDVPGSSSEQAAPQAKKELKGSKPAWLFFTSGSTGQPKGVVYTNAHLLHCGQSMVDGAGMTAESAVLYQTANYWAVASCEMVSPFIGGGRLIISPPETQKSPAGLVEILTNEKVTTACLTPKVLELVLDVLNSRKEVLPTLLDIVGMGDALPRSTCERFQQCGYIPNAKLHNLYGATESGTLWFTVPKDGLNPVLFPSFCPAGAPVAGSQVWIMNKERIPVKTGEVGEICFGGQLSDGYWRDPDLTRARFPTVPKYGRLYCSGDLGKWHHGVLTVAGRMDRQMKIRGIRVEPEEVEVLARKCWQELCGARYGANVACVATTGESPQLVLVLSPKATSEELKAVEDACKAGLPPGYVPSAFLSLERLPLLSNQKVDLAAVQTYATTEMAAGVPVLDSLGRMRVLVRGEVYENEIIQRCYIIWMMADVTFHWNYPYNPYLPLWIQVVLKGVTCPASDLGFMWSVAFQDSRVERGQTKPTLTWGVRDVYVVLLYWLIGCLAFISSDDPGWPGFTGNPRWFLRAYLEGKVLVWAFQKIETRVFPVPGLLQIWLALVLVLITDTELMDLAKYAWMPTIMKKVLGVLVSSDCISTRCPLWKPETQWFAVFYLAGYHFAQPMVQLCRMIIKDRFDGICGCIAAGCTYWAIAWVVQLNMYNDLEIVLDPDAPQVVLPPQYAWAVVRHVVFGIIQCLLLPLAMSGIPFSLRWWGDTILGTFAFHTHFVIQQWASLMLQYPQFYMNPPLLLLMILLPTFVQLTWIGPTEYYALMWILLFLRKGWELLTRCLPGWGSSKGAELSEAQKAAESAGGA